VLNDNWGIVEALMTTVTPPLPLKRRLTVLPKRTGAAVAEQRSTSSPPAQEQQKAVGKVIPELNVS